MGWSSRRDYVRTHDLDAVDLIAANLTEKWLSGTSMACQSGCTIVAAIAHGCRSDSLKLVDSCLIHQWLRALSRSQYGRSSGTDVIEQTQPALHTHGMVPSSGQQGCMGSGIKRGVADNTVHHINGFFATRRSRGDLWRPKFPHDERPTNYRIRTLVLAGSSSASAAVLALEDMEGQEK
jgi:hypothetical protein